MFDGSTVLGSPLLACTACCFVGIALQRWLPPHRCAVAGLMLLGVALCGVAVVTFNAVFGVAAGWVADPARRWRYWPSGPSYHYSREGPMTRQARFSIAVDEEVALDGNLTSSRSPKDLPAFCAAIVE
jgi:hypothetical protein